MPLQGSQAASGALTQSDMSIVLLPYKLWIGSLTKSNKGLSGVLVHLPLIIVESLSGVNELLLFIKHVLIYCAGFKLSR